MVGMRFRRVRELGRLLCLAAVALLAAALLACGAEGHEPGATDLATVSAVVDRLAASEDPRRAFADFPAETRQAVIDYLTVEKTASAGLSGPPAPIAAPQGCHRQAAGYTARNAHGRDLWTYLSSTEWCWADGLISTVPAVTTGVEVHTPLWEFAGHIHQHETGGQGEASHSDWTLGVFQLCPANPDDCVHEEEILVAKWQHGDGGYDFDIEPIVPVPNPYELETTPAEAEPPLVGIVYTLLIVVPICAAAFSVGWVVRRSGARGSLVWSLGVVVTAWGASVALEHGLRILVFDAHVLPLSGLSVAYLYLPLTESFPPIVAALGAGWLMWKAAGRGSATWALGVAALAVGAVSVVRAIAPVAVYLPAAIGSLGLAPVTEVEVETVVTDLPVEVFEASSAYRDRVTVQDGTCGPHRRGIEGRNLIGQRLWTFRSETRWCWNGREVGADPSFWPTVGVDMDTPVPFWRSNSGRDAYADDDDLPWELSDRATGVFFLCPPLLECVQNAYAAVEKRQFSDGTTTVDYPSLTDASQRNPLHPALGLLPSIVMGTAALVTGWVVLRRSRRGSAAWGVGVVATGLGVLVPVLVVIVGVFFLTSSYAVF